MSRTPLTGRLPLGRRSPLARQRRTAAKSPSPRGNRTPFLARLRVGRKLMLLVLLPVTGMLVFTVFSAVAQWQEARRLDRFHTATKVSFATTEVSDAVARERIAAVLARLRPGPVTLAERSAAERATDRTLLRATARAASWPHADVAGELDAVGRQLHAARVQTGTASLTAPAVVQQYQTIEDELLDSVSALESGRPTRAAGRAADAHIALVKAIEAAERERAELAVVLAEPADRRPTAAGRWSALEEAQLREFRQNTSDRLSAELYSTQFEAPGRAVRKVRDMLTSEPRAVHWPTYDRWLADSKARIESLRGIQDQAAQALDGTSAHDLHVAENKAARDLAGSLAVLLVVTVLALALRRSITRPLSEVSAGARALSSGDLSYDIRYAGRDELGDVADTFRELRVSTERLAAEIRSMNTAIDDNRLEHRADVASFDGTWAQLLGGMNGTMASFAAAHGRRKKAEEELEGIFNLSSTCCASPVSTAASSASTRPSSASSATRQRCFCPGRTSSSSTRRTGPAPSRHSNGWPAASSWPSSRTATCAGTAPSAGSSGAPGRSPRRASSTPPPATSPRAAAPPGNRPRCAGSPPWWPAVPRRPKCSRGWRRRWGTC